MLKRLMSGVLSLAMLGTMFPSAETAEKTQPVVQQGENPVSSPMDYQLSSTNSLGNFINDVVEKQNNMLNASAATETEEGKYSIGILDYNAESREISISSAQTYDCKALIVFSDEFSGEKAYEKTIDVKSGEDIINVCSTP